MALKPPTPGLRRIHYDARSVGKVDLRVQDCDVLDVSPGIADQLLAASAQFKEGDPPVRDVEPDDEAPADAEDTPQADDAPEAAQAPKRRGKTKG